MRLLFIICDASADARVMGLLDRLEVPGYTRFTGAIGNGPRGRREGTPIWPGQNSLVMTCVPEEMVAGVLAALDKLSAERQGRLALKVFSVPAEQYE
jgi:hypothetical protein